MNNASIEQRRLNATPRGVGVACGFYAQRAENATLWDVEGRAYTDFAAGIAVLNTGHRHPAVVAAVTAQLDCFTHTAYQVVPYERAVSLAERINAAAPIAGPVKTAFFTTGAEAVENAVKIARAATGRPGVIAFSGAFHGRTLMTLALTGKVAPYKVGFGPFPSDVYHVPFPSELHCVSVHDSLNAIVQLFKSDIDPRRVAAIIIEPVQGEGGFNVAPPALMEGLRGICDEHGILLICDEIQTGFGRTGKLFAVEHYAIQPDLLTMAKSLSGGLPLSAVCGRAKVMDAPAPGGLGGTYAANPLAVAAAHAVFDTIENEGLLQRSTQLGAQLRAFLQEQRKHNPFIAEVRGLGSMIAVEFCEPDAKPSAAMAQRVQQLALSRGLILLTCGVHANVIRFLYPLTVPAAQFDAALKILGETLSEAIVPTTVV
jgi:4-aminobutyrate aminotransferase